MMPFFTDALALPQRGPPECAAHGLFIISFAFNVTVRRIGLRSLGETGQLPSQCTFEPGLAKHLGSRKEQLLSHHWLNRQPLRFADNQRIFGEFTFVSEPADRGVNVMHRHSASYQTGFQINTV